MEKHKFGNVDLEFLSDSRLSDFSGRLATSIVAKLSTSDGLKAEIEIQDAGGNDILVKLTEFLSPPPPLYSHLNRNGAMTVQRRADGFWVAPLRALRPGGKPYPTLNHISLEELDFLLAGDSAAWLEGLGFEVGTWGSVKPSAVRFKDSLGLAIPESRAQLLALPWSLTRVVALMKGLGKIGLEVS
jgi:hypothetical protein